MKEIGGYIELDEVSGEEYHKTAIALNCGRNCLAYLLEARRIVKLYIPIYMCATTKDVCEMYNVQYEYYHIDSHFQPIIEDSIEESAYVYIVSYYGWLTDDKIEQYRIKWKNVIVDNVQDFFRLPILGVDTIYSCRKYFGVCDGAYLYTDAELKSDIKQDISFERFHYILGRYEEDAQTYYSESAKNNYSFSGESIKFMSKLTHNLLRRIDYDNVQRIRKSNYKYLHECLNEFNELGVDLQEGTFMYPLLLKNGNMIRANLQKKKIYIPLLWPDVFDICKENSMEWYFASNLLLLPIDQRYGREEMKYIVEEVCVCIKEGIHV